MCVCVCVCIWRGRENIIISVYIHKNIHHVIAPKQYTVWVGVRMCTKKWRRKHNNNNIILVIGKTHYFDEHSVGHATCIIEGLGKGKKPRAKGRIHDDKDCADRRASASREGAYFPRVEEEIALCISTVGDLGLLNAVFLAKGRWNNERC